MWITAHNPSSLDLKSMEIAVPEDINFKASVFNTSSKMYEPT